MKKSVILDGNVINKNSKPYLVAEIGINHNKDLKLTAAMIKEAKKAGADAVKFQSYITEKLINKKSGAFSILKELELSKEEFYKISELCKKENITFFSTPFCIECVDWLEEMDVPFYKIASSDLNYFELLKYVADTGKPLIISTGMSKINEIEKAVNTIVKSGNENIVILHCVSKYPPDYNDMNMRMIEKLDSMFDYPIGFSDHTPDATMAVVARVLGACLFEKHFTIDKNLEGPDQAISSTPEDFVNLKEKLVFVDHGLLYHEEPADKMIAEGARRGIYASKDLKAGEILNKEMINIIRPSTNLRPEDIDLIIGKKISKDIKEAEAIDHSFFNL